jgi:hypothetical protein
MSASAAASRRVSDHGIRDPGEGLEGDRLPVGRGLFENEVFHGTLRDATASR